MADTKVWYTIRNKENGKMVPALDDSGVLDGDGPGLVFRTRECAQSVCECQAEMYGLDCEVVELSEIESN